MERAKKMIIVPEEILHRIHSVTNVTVQSSSLSSSPQQQQQQTLVKQKKKEQEEEAAKEENNCVHENSVQTCGDNLSRLDAEMHEILHRKKFIDDREKAKNYLQVLRRYLFFKEAERYEEKEKETNTVESDTGITFDTILENVSAVNQRKARLLLDHLRKTDQFTWNSDGVIIINGKKIENSNVIDLLNDVLTKKSKNKKQINKNSTIDRDDGDDDDEDEEITPIGQSEFAKFIKLSNTPQNLINNAETLKLGKKLTVKRRVEQTQFTPMSTRAGAAKKKWLKFEI